MANTNAPFGFRQYSGNGSAPTYEQVPALIAYNADPIYFGDVVYPTTDGTIISRSPTTDPVAGVFVGCKYLSVSQKRTVWSNYFPGIGDVNSASAVTAYVVTDPNAQFMVQTANSNTTASAVGVSAIGQNIGVAYGTAPSGSQGTNTNTLGSNNGNVANGLSTAYADQYTLTTPGGTSATLPFRVIALANYTPDGSNPLAGINGNDSTTAYNRIIVGFNNAAMKSGVTGI